MSVILSELDVNKYYSKEEIIERWGVFPCFYEKITNANTNNPHEKEANISRFLQQYHRGELPVRSRRHGLLLENYKKERRDSFLCDLVLEIERGIEVALKQQDEEAYKEKKDLVKSIVAIINKKEKSLLEVEKKMNEIDSISIDIKKKDKRWLAEQAERVAFAKGLVDGKDLLDFEKNIFLSVMRIAVTIRM